MDRNSQNSSTAFSPSLFDQYNKNKQGLQGPPQVTGPAGNQALAAQAQAALNAAAAWSYGLGNISGKFLQLITILICHCLLKKMPCH